MIHLANSGLAGLPVSGPISAAIGDEAMPGAPSQQGEAGLNTLKNKASFADIFRPVQAQGVSARLPTPAGLDAILDPTLPQLLGTQLPELNLPGGNALPVAPDSLPQSELPAALQPELRDPAGAMPIQPLANEDAFQEKPAFDRLSKAQAGLQPFNLGTDTATSPQPTTRAAAPVTEASQQVSSLAMAAAQILSADRTIQNKARGTSAQAEQRAVPTDPSKSALVSASSAQLGATLATASVNPLLVDAEPDLDAKPLVTKPFTDASQQPSPQQSAQQATAPAPSTSNTAAPGPALAVPSEGSQQTLSDGKPVATQLARADQQATFDRVSDQITLAKEALPNSAQLRLPHEQFGAIRMQLELASAGLKVTLGNNDPGFAQSVQVALAERVSAVSDTARSESSTSQHQGQSSSANSGQSAAQNGAMMGQNRDPQESQIREELTFGEALFNEQHQPPESSSKPRPKPPASGLYA